VGEVTKCIQDPIAVDARQLLLFVWALSCAQAIGTRRYREATAQDKIRKLQEALMHSA
jgi:hypothetical protein